MLELEIPICPLGRGAWDTFEFIGKKSIQKIIKAFREKMRDKFLRQYVPGDIRDKDLHILNFYTDHILRSLQKT